MYRELGYMELHFAEILWEKAPIKTGELCRICEDKLNWKRTTTYTVLKKLCNEGIFSNTDGTVITLKNKEEYETDLSRQYVEDKFSGSLPCFIAAFTRGRGLTPDEADELMKLIDSFK